MAEARQARAWSGAYRTWKRLNLEQRVAAVGALLLLVSTFGPFSFVEGAEILVALGVLALLRARAAGRDFHVPFGDGGVVLAAGGWAALLILVRLFDRPLGQNLLALACAAILMLAGLRERSKRPADDLPPEHSTPPIRRRRPGAESDWIEEAPDPPTRRLRGEELTVRDDAGADPLPPPEFDPPTEPLPPPPEDARGDG